MQNLGAAEVETFFQELISASERASTNEAPIKLTANLDGTRIYDSRVGWGYFLEIIYTLVCCIWPKLREDNLKAAFSHIQTVFNEAISQLVVVLKEHEEMLQKICNPRYGEKVDDAVFQSSRTAILNWVGATNIFFIWIKTHENSLAPLFQEYLNTDQPFQMPKDLRNRCKRYARMAQLENVIRKPLPLPALSALAKGNELGTDQKKTLSRWFSDINGKKDQIGIRLFHQTIHSIATFAAGTNDPIPLSHSIALMETRLVDMLPRDDRGKAILWEKDPQLLARRDRYQPGDLIRCNQKQYRLGEQIGPKQEKAEDEYLVFDLHPEEETGDMIKPAKQVVIIGKNAAVIGIKALRHGDYSKKRGAFPIVKYLEVDSRGRCGIMQKVPHAFMVQPTSQRIPIAIMLIKTMVDQGRTPILKTEKMGGRLRSVFSAHYLGMDDEQSIMATRIASTEDGEINFRALVQLARDSVDTDQSAFHNIMHSSGLSNHPFAIYFRDIFEEALQDKAAQEKMTTGEFLIDKMKQKPKVPPAIFMQDAEIFYIEVQQTKVSIVAALKERGITDTLVDAKMREFYSESGAICLLWPSARAMQERVLDSLLKKPQE